jgi:transcriptional regulator with XRE-family HTH domain
MVIGEKLKAMREQKHLSQGDIEKRTGLLRCYISRVENGHTVPAIETLKRMAQALEVPMYGLFTDDDHVKTPNLPAEYVLSRAVRSNRTRSFGLSPNYSHRWMTKIAGFCFTWRRR